MRQAVNTSTGDAAGKQSRLRQNRVTSWSASQTFTLTNDGQWHQYTLPFTGGDVAFTGGQNQGRLDFKMTAQQSGSAETGAAIYIDDVYLRQGGDLDHWVPQRSRYLAASSQSRLVTLWSVQPAGNQ